MKKIIKLSALILTLVMVCAYFSGCDNLDEKRKHHATFTNEGEYDSITYNGEVYKRLDFKTPTPPNPMYNSPFEEHYVYVTNPDDPVLLCEEIGLYMVVSNDMNFIIGDELPYEESTAEFASDYTEYIYCKADIYDDINSKIEAGINYSLYGYCHCLDNVDEDGKEYDYYFLKPEEIEAVNNIIESIEPTTPNDDFWHTSIYILTLDIVSDDKMFGEAAIDIYRDSNVNYVLCSYDSDLGRENYYVVPSSYDEIFEEIIKASVTYGTYME